MSRCCLRLLAIFVAALATILAPLSTNAAMDTRRSECCDHAMHQADHCSDCIVCATGLSCVLPAGGLLRPEGVVVIERLDWEAWSAESRAYPPPLPPPRAAA